MGDKERATEKEEDKEDLGESVEVGLMRDERVSEGDPEEDLETRGEGVPVLLLDLSDDPEGDGDTVLDWEPLAEVEALPLPPVALAEPPPPPHWRVWVKGWLWRRASQEWGGRR